MDPLHAGSVDPRSHRPVDGPNFRLFNWHDRRNGPGPSGHVFAELTSTRAVVVGRRTYEVPAAGTATATTAYRSSF